MEVLSMKFKIDKKELSSLTTLVHRAASIKDISPVLSGLLLEADPDKGLIMTATDMEIGIRASTHDVEVLEKGYALVNAHYFADFIRLLPDSQIFIELDEELSKLKIKYGRSSISLNIYQVQEYPDLPLEKAENNISLPQRVIRDGLRKTVFAAATNHFRHVFTGVLFDFTEQKKLKIVASDTHRLACYIYDMSDEKDLEPFNFIIPLRSANEILRLLDESDEKIKIAFSGNNVIFYKDKIIVLSRLIDGQYPNYEKVFPVSFITTVKIKSDILAQILERAKIMPTDDKIKAPHVQFNFKEKEATVSTYSDIMGEIEEFIEDLFIEGENDLKINFNTNYFLDVVKILGNECDEIVIRFSGPLSPAEIKNPEEENYMYILVPMRTSK